MKKFFENLKKSKLAIIFISFIFGGIFTYIITDYIHLKTQGHQKAEVTSKVQKQNPTSNIHDPFDQHFKSMQKKMNKMFKGSPFSGGFFDEDFGSFGMGKLSGDDIKIIQREDDDFSYIEIESEGIDHNHLNIKVANGMIDISGEIKKEIGSQGNNSNSRGEYISKFQRSFNVPYGVDESKMDVKTEKGKVVIKFPKTIKA